MNNKSATTEVVTMSLLRYVTNGGRWWAFTQMGLGPRVFQRIPGLKTIKPLGSGAGNGFSIWPNWGVYGLLAVWEDEDAAAAFFATHPWWRQAGKYTSERYTVFLRTAMVHGEWGGVSPFAITTDFDAAAPVAVLTRATIKLRHLIGFWRYVPRVSASVKDKPGQLISIGVGEWPLFMQATFSIWTSSKAMVAYAYQSQFHKEVVQRTRELGWYKEELFARFVPYRSEGTWSGKNVTADILNDTVDN